MHTGDGLHRVAAARGDLADGRDLRSGVLLLVLLQSYYNIIHVMTHY